MPRSFPPGAVRRALAALVLATGACGHGGDRPHPPPSGQAADPTPVAAEQPAPGDAVASVGGRAIPRADLERLLELARREGPFGALAGAEPAVDAGEALLELVREALLELEAARRELATAPGASARDALAADIGRRVTVSDDELRRFVADNPQLYRRPAQMRFLHVRLPAAGQAAPEPASAAEMTALAERATAADPEGRQWGDVGWLAVGNAPWQRQPPWRPEAVGGAQVWDDGRGGRHVVRAMHYRPPAAFDPDQVATDARERAHRERVDAELKRLLLELARTTPVAVLDPRLPPFEPEAVVRGEPGPPLELLERAAAGRGGPAGMVPIAGGAFTTGSTAAEIDERVELCRRYVEPAIGPGACARAKYEDEVQRRVAIGAFRIDRTEVTGEAYREFVAAARHRPLPAEPRPGEPVTGVSLEDAERYCRWLGRRLPTADEWELAARGLASRRYEWGSDPPDGTRGNFCDLRCPMPWRNPDHDDGYAGPAPVGSYPAGATPEGVLDLAGNAREWTATRSGDLAQVKGGGYLNAVDDMIPADVRANHVETRDPALGFRCAVSAGGVAP